MLKNFVVVESDDARHDVIDLATLKFAFSIAEDEFACSVDLVHDSTVFAVKFKKNDPMLLVQVCFCPCCDLFLLVVVCLQLSGLLQYLQSRFFVVEHLDEISCI